MKSIATFASRIFFIILISVIISQKLFSADAPKPTLPGGNDKWRMTWCDEFDYPDAMLDATWNSANGAQTWILCSRWRKNAVVSNGTLKLMNKKESLVGQDWTSGSIWTKQHFKYGYYECRYKYAAATGTNNSFWLMSQSAPAVGKKFEIDINEGHYPSEMATNIHNWTDITVNPTTGASTHPSSSKKYLFGQSPDVSIQLEIPITTRKIRLTSNYAAHFHIQEFRIYNVNAAGYPTVLSSTADRDKAGLVNYARDAQTKITSSGVYGTGWELPKVADGTLSTHWVSQATGVKWLEFEFANDKTIGCIQFVSGWISGSTYMSVLNDFKVQYFDGTEWVDIQSVIPTDGEVNFGRDFHYFGLEWTADSLKFYADGVLKRAEKNTFCYSAAPIYLSEAIISWAGAVTDAIDGTQMEVDYVRVYERKPLTNEPYDYIKNGGFEVTAAGTTNWEMTRDQLNFSVFTWQQTQPADGLVSCRVTSEASTNPFGASLSQRLILDEGEYLFRFKARSSGVSADANKFLFKFSNMYNNTSLFMDNQMQQEVVPSSEWKSYSYRLNLKQDYSGKVSFGFNTVGTFDMDSISLVRLGPAVVASVKPTKSNTASVYSSQAQIVIDSMTKQSLEVFSLDGAKVLDRQIGPGKQVVTLQQTGVFLVRLRNDFGLTTHKVFVGL